MLPHEQLQIQQQQFQRSLSPTQELVDQGQTKEQDQTSNRRLEKTIKQVLLEILNEQSSEIQQRVLQQAQPSPQQQMDTTPAVEKIVR